MRQLQGKKTCAIRSVLPAVLICSAFAAKAELVTDVQNFLEDRDRIIALRLELEEDRAAMATHLDDNQALRDDVRALFLHRLEIITLRALKAIDRKQLKRTLQYKREKLQKPGLPDGDLRQLATLYIQHYDQWLALKATVLNDLDQMRAAAEAGDEATLTQVATAFFDHRRERATARLNWQAALKALRKSTDFRKLPKPKQRPRGSLSEIVSEYLSDRAEWEALKEDLEAARNVLRAALESTDSIDGAVISFLETRRARRVKKLELDLDRESMRKKLKIRKNRRSRREAVKDDRFSSKDLDKDDEDEALGESAN